MTTLHETRMLHIIRDFQFSSLNATGQIEFQPDFLPKNVSLAKLQKINNHRSSYEIFKRAYSAFYECQKQRYFSKKM